MSLIGCSMRCPPDQFFGASAKVTTIHWKYTKTLIVHVLPNADIINRIHSLPGNFRCSLLNSIPCQRACLAIFILCKIFNDYSFTLTFPFSFLMWSRHRLQLGRYWQHHMLVTTLPYVVSWMRAPPRRHPFVALPDLGQTSRRDDVETD